MNPFQNSNENIIDDNNHKSQSSHFNLKLQKSKNFDSKSNENIDNENDNSIDDELKIDLEEQEEKLKEQNEPETEFEEILKDHIAEIKNATFKKRSIIDSKKILVFFSEFIKDSDEILNNDNEKMIESTNNSVISSENDDKMDEDDKEEDNKINPINKNTKKSLNFNQFASVFKSKNYKNLQNYI